jgi:glutathione peroxidase
MKMALMAFVMCTLFLHIENASAQEADIYSIKVNDIDGKEVDLSQYKGKTLLIVNTASQCGYTKQYKPLEELYSTYKDKGLVVLGFPANNFKGQEPGSNEEIKSFCLLNYKVDFPMFSKISVLGEDIHPLYQYLTGDKVYGGLITWNFNKFLISKDGKILARYGSPVSPMAPELIAKVEESLAK